MLIFRPLSHLKTTLIRASAMSAILREPRYSAGDLRICAMLMREDAHEGARDAIAYAFVMARYARRYAACLMSSMRRCLFVLRCHAIARGALIAREEQPILFFLRKRRCWRERRAYDNMPCARERYLPPL